MSGWHDVPLSAEGRKEIALLAHRLQREGGIAGIYSSTLRRAADTAAAIASATELPITYVPELKEINCGEVDGHEIEQVKRDYPMLWQANLRQDDPDFKWPNGESYRQFRMRCLTGLRRIVANHADRQVVLVTHAGVISQIIGYVQGMSPARWEAFRPATASVSVLEWQDQSTAILSFNDRSHLLSDDSIADGSNLPMRKAHRP
jgi:2,3-bisphosphoglycerate-dependent phosphoglycerate mutase